MSYANFLYYTNDYLGTLLNEFEYEYASAKASAFLDYYTMGRAKDNAESEALKMACCAVAEQCHIERLAVEAMANGLKNGGKTSESVGSYSVSYATSSEAAQNAQNARAEMAKAAQRYLAGTGILYRGVSRCTRRTL